MSDEREKDPRMEPAEYLAARLDDQINWYDTKSLSCQKWYKRLRKIELALSASIPIIVGLGLINICGKIYIAIAGATITIITGIHGLYDYQEHWIEYRSTSEILKHEKYLYLTGSGPYADTPNPFNLLVERTEGIISRENINWSLIHGREAKRISADHFEKASSPTGS